VGTENRPDIEELSQTGLDLIFRVYRYLSFIFTTEISECPLTNSKKTTADTFWPWQIHRGISVSLFLLCWQADAFGLPATKNMIETNQNNNNIKF
jgi:hypothetical protein